MSIFNRFYTFYEKIKDNIVNYFFDKTITGLYNGLDRFFNATSNFFDSIPTIPNKVKNKICSYWPFVYFLNQSEKNNLLLDAIDHNNIHQLKTMINAGANVNTSRMTTTALISAVLQNNIEIVTLLINNAAKPSIRSLHTAWENDYIEIVQCLLKALDPEIIEAEFNHAQTTPELKKFIKTFEEKKLQLELFTIYSKNKSSSPFTQLPIEVLTFIFSENYRTLTPIQILNTIKLNFNNAYSTNESNMSEATSPNRLI